MKGQIRVKTLNESGIYASDLDWDNSFKDKKNPEGWFKMVIEPIENSDGKHEIRYMLVPGGYIVSGEAYIISEATEAAINARIRKNHPAVYTDVVHTKVKNEGSLW